MGGNLAAVAIGGNSLIRDRGHPELPHQWDAVRETCTHLAEMVEQGWNIVVTHGNGPQVGFILRRSEIAAVEVHTVPLDIIGADTQGSIGYMLQQALENEFRRRRLDKRVASLVTQVLVDADDPGFQNPTKPIGGYLTEEKAQQFRREGWNVIEDAGRGLRRVVASPIPHKIIELDAINALIAQGFIVVAVGGGGIAAGNRHQGRPVPDLDERGEGRHQLQQAEPAVARQNDHRRGTPVSGRRSLCRGQYEA
jgi:carbamate kinase